MLLQGTIIRVLPAGRVLCEIQETGRKMPVFNYSGDILTVGQTVLVTENREIAKKATYKADLWRRTTSTEAEQILQALDTQPVNLKMVFQDAMFLDHLHEEYSQVEEVIVQLFGEERASELLAPSVDNTTN